MIYAEARAELGQITQGDLDLTINKLRSRVGTVSYTHLDVYKRQAKNIGSAPWYNADALDRLAKNIANPGSAPVMFGRADGLTWNIGSMGLGAAANTDWYDILYKDYSSRQKLSLIHI